VAREHGLPSYVSEQPPFNLLDRRIEDELVPLCQRYGLAILPWSPLAAGILAGRYDSADTFPDDSRAARREPVRARITEAGLDVARRLGELARERGLTTSQLALLWVKDQPGITAPIVGPRTMAQLDDALGILDASLDDDARAACDELVHPGNAVSDFHNTTGWIRSAV
jgi:aryl-alcohol dehydrogenase-like predicted oxidoreductase